MVAKKDDKKIEIIDLTVDENFIREQDEHEKRVEFILENMKLRIAERIATELNKKNLSYSEFAKMLNVSQPYISKIMNGKPNLTIKSLAEIASVLGLKIVDDIFIESVSNEMFQACQVKSSYMKWKENIGGSLNQNYSLFGNVCKPFLKKVNNFEEKEEEDDQQPFAQAG